MSPQPQTKTNELIDSLNLLRGTGFYADANSLGWRKIKRDCERLLDVDAAAGWSVMGMLYATVGDVEETNACFARATKLTNDLAFKLNWCSSLSALGQFVQALDLLPEIIRPQGGEFQAGIMTGMEIGAFKMMGDQLNVAREMGVDMSGLPVGVIQEAAAIMDGAGITDQDIANHLEAAGAVLRANKAFDVLAGDVLTSQIAGGLTGITMVLRVVGTPLEVFQLNKALARKERELEIRKSPAFDILIASANEYA
jgi:tetratricopeptide (TPR) repeat protein